MRLRFLTATLAVGLVAASAGAHDLFMTLRSHFVAPNSTARVTILNGTFSKSEGAVSPTRLRDLSVVSGGARRALDRALWDSSGTAATLRVPVGEAGTYVVGASLLSREITIEGKGFTGYLTDEGILPILELRRQKGETDKPARERYAKHVKALIQVGSTRTSDPSTILGYPAELVALDNPFSVRRGGWLRVRALVEGNPAVNQVVIAGGRTPGGARLRQQRVRTNSEGIARIRLATRGRYYVKFIHMEPYTGSDPLDYESKWATMTFEVR